MRSSRKLLLLWLARSGSEWTAFFHQSNKVAAALCADGLLDRRRWDRPQGGFEYRLNQAGRSSLSALRLEAE